MYYHAKSGGPSSKIGSVIAVWKSVQIRHTGEGEGGEGGGGKTQLY